MTYKKRVFLCRTNSAHVHGIMRTNYYEKYFVELNILKVLPELAIFEGSAAYYSRNRKRLQNFRREGSHLKQSYFLVTRDTAKLFC
jgi:hypothetical protein